MANARNYKNFIWHNQTINDKLVNFVRVRIYKPVDTVVSNGHMKLVDTDGDTISKSTHSHLRHTSNYSYVILSSSIQEKSSIANCCHLYLHIKVYITDDFEISMLEDGKDFPEKAYILKALNGEKESEPKLLDYLQEKVGPDDYGFLHHTLLVYAHLYKFDKIEELFKTYNIPAKYQALFWKERYEETKTWKERYKETKTQK